MTRREVIKATALMTGYAVSASVLGAIMQGCQARQKVDLSKWQPMFFTKEQGLTVAAMSEQILPYTKESPGATDVFVHEYIDVLLAECTDEKGQQKFRDGFAQFEADCQSTYGKPFGQCDAEQQLEYMNKLDVAARALVKPLTRAELAEKLPFILKFKEMTIAGYFSSKEVAMNILNYDPVPGQYVGCYPIAEVKNGRSWAL
ncbi:MAG: gluconate 2-dehydrogenase subunit 3 family protein [Saprospiraceae bacterium]|nr:gluconate 2-dehydrogenase subunit 3 family protein [Saprospiraceae bacterium]